MHIHNPDTSVHWAIQCAIYTKQCVIWHTCTYTWAYTSTRTVPANQRNASSTSSPRETMNVITARDNVRDYRERRRTWSSYEFTTRDDKHDHRERRHMWLPQETTNVFTARDNAHDYLERRRTCSPRETTYMTTSRDDEHDHRVHSDHRVPRVRVGVVTGSDTSQTLRVLWRLV